MRQAETLRTGLVLALATFVTFAIFGLWPGIDLAVSGWFHRPDDGFWLDRQPLLEAIRNAIWAVAVALAVGATVLAATGAAMGRNLLGIETRLWGFVSALFILAPGLLVNVLLKSHWGRARPANVTEFGGTALFTPPWEITDQCQKNCSFVSGEVSAAVALAISIWVLSQGLAAPWRRMLRALGGMLALICAAQRIAAGRHFLSDALLAGLFTGLIAVGLWAAMTRRSR